MAHFEMTMFLKRCEVSQHDIRNETSIDKGFKYQSYITNLVVESNSQWYKDTSIDQKNANP